MNYPVNRKRTLNFLHYKCGLHWNIVNELLIQYGKDCDLPKTYTKHKRYIAICDLIQSDWNKFIQWLDAQDLFIKNRHKVGKKRKRNRRPSTYYDEWFQRSQLDGTFAYNGVSDDF